MTPRGAFLKRDRVIEKLSVQEQFKWDLARI
jgi:hypothetical protein